MTTLRQILEDQDFNVDKLLDSVVGGKFDNDNEGITVILANGQLDVRIVAALPSKGD